MWQSWDPSQSALGAMTVPLFLSYLSERAGNFFKVTQQLRAIPYPQSAHESWCSQPFFPQQSRHITDDIHLHITYPRIDPRSHDDNKVSVQTQFHTFLICSRKHNRTQLKVNGSIIGRIFNPLTYSFNKY